MAQTARFKFNKFGGSEEGTLSDNGQKYSSLDRDTLEKLAAAVKARRK